MTYSNTLKALATRYPNGAPAGIKIEDLAQLKIQKHLHNAFGYCQGDGQSYARRYGGLR